MEGDEARYRKILETFEPNRLKLVLAEIGLFLMTYETLKTFIIGHTRDFFGLELLLPNQKTPPSEEYKEHVLARDKSEVVACLNWLEEMSAITPSDSQKFFEIREYRNGLAHELGTKLLTHDWRADRKLYDEAVNLVEKIGRFWGTVEVDTDPDIDHSKVDYDGIKPVASVLLSYLHELLVADAKEG